MIYEIFKYLTDVPYNFWGWLLLITAPVLVFIVGPEKNFWWRLGKLVVAIGLTYIMINLTLHTKRALDYKDYEECERNSIHRQMSIEMFEECKHHINVNDSASIVFLLIFGVIPATGYVGFCELIWFLKHKSKIKQMGKDYKGNWMSYTTFIFIIPLAIYTLFILVIGIFLRVMSLFLLD